MEGAPYGYSKRRTWRKVHRGVDADSHEVVAALVTTNGVGDGEGLPHFARSGRRGGLSPEWLS